MLTVAVQEAKDPEEMTCVAYVPLPASTGVSHRCLLWHAVAVPARPVHEMYEPAGQVVQLLATGALPVLDDALGDGSGLRDTE